MPNFVPAVELIYRALAQPKAPETKPTPATHTAKKTELTRSDVDEILQHKRAATAAELEQIIGSAKDYKLTQSEREQLSLALTIQVAQARQSNGRREDPSARLIYDLGYALTPFGLLAERAWFERELQAGTKAIAACKRHSPPCSCWNQARENLYDIRASFGERSPESWAAIRIWEALEEMELASRPERIGNQLGYGSGYFDDHWRGVGTGIDRGPSET